MPQQCKNCNERLNGVCEGCVKNCKKCYVVECNGYSFKKNFDKNNRVYN